LVGIELDPLAALLLRANLAVNGMTDRAAVLQADYRSATLGAAARAILARLSPRPNGWT
jgi:tRNA1(Val) A37 N6-methylase TrmN6